MSGDDPKLRDDEDRAIGFVLRLARAMHAAGAPAHRLEEAMAALSPRLGMAGQFLSTPTSLLAAFGEPPVQRTFLLRIEPGEVDLGRLANLDALTGDLAAGRLGAAAGLERLEALEREPDRYPGWLTTLSFALASATAARFFGGAWPEVLVAGAIGLVTGVLRGATRRRPAIVRLFEPGAALIAALIAGAAAAAFPPISPFIASLAGVILLVPGLALTTSLTELATRNLVAGTARFAGVMMSFLAVGGGLALGSALGSRFWNVAPNPTPAPIGAWTEWIALVVSPLALTVLFRARPRDAGWIVAIGALAFVSARVATRYTGPELGTFLAATVVGIASNVYARARGRVAEVTMVPGILMLIPGSIGLRSVSSLIAQDVVTGVALAFTLVLAAVALAAGLLFANVAVTPRRSTEISPHAAGAS